MGENGEPKVGPFDSFLPLLSSGHLTSLTGGLEMGDRKSGFLKLLLRLNCCKFFML